MNDFAGSLGKECGRCTPVECQQQRYDGSLLRGGSLVEHQLVGADRFVYLRWVGLKYRTLGMRRTLSTPEPLL